MAPSPEKDVLHLYLKAARQAVVWKLEGLGDYDARRPLVPTGTNLVGLVKHLATVESGYFGEVFGRPFPEPLAWMAEGSHPTDDSWATAQESVEDIVSLYRRVWAHSDATIDSLELDSTGAVPWWPEDRRQVTLQLVLVHMTTETHRHAGHADIIRELIDGAAGLRPGGANLPTEDPEWWAAHRRRVEEAARRAAGR